MHTYVCRIPLPSSPDGILVGWSSCLASPSPVVDSPCCYAFLFAVTILSSKNDGCHEDRAWLLPQTALGRGVAGGGGGRGSGAGQIEQAVPPRPARQSFQWHLGLVCLPRCFLRC